MDYPVDVLGSASHQELEQEAEAYLTELRHVNPDQAQSFTLSNHRKIRVSLANVGYVPVYGGDLRHKVLALFAPEDQLTAVALFLAGEWWTVEDVLKTSDASRVGLIKVRTLGERIALYVLNRIVYRVGEMEKAEIPFLCHSQHDFAKILWKDGQAVGFYTVKPKDSLSVNFVTQRYHLPVMDSIFIRKCQRRNGHGLQMLEDFVDSFKDDELGLKYPLSAAMYKVCSQYLYHYPADENLLWVVEGVGGPYQREKVASKLKTFVPKVNVELFAANGDHQTQTELTDMETDKNEATSVNCTDVVEDCTAANKSLKVLEDTEETPVSTRTRSSDRKRPRQETEEAPEENLPSKINRVEEMEATTTTPVMEEAEAEGDEGDKSPVSTEGEADVEAAEAPLEKEAAAEASAEEVEEEVDGTVDQGDDVEEEEKVTEDVPQELVLENGTATGDVAMEEVEEEKGEEVDKEQEPTSVEDTADEPSPMEAEEQEAEAQREEEDVASSQADQTPEEEPSSTVVETAEETGGEPPGSAEATKTEEAVPAAPEEPEEEEEVEAAEASEEKQDEEEAEDEEQESEPGAADGNKEAVVLVGVADLIYQPPDEGTTPAEEDKEEEEEKDVEKEEEEGKAELAEEAAVTFEEDKEVTERSSDEAEEAPAARRKGRRSKATQRRSKRLSRAPAAQDDAPPTEEEEEEGEEEEEKTATTEEEEEEEEEGVSSAEKPSAGEEEDEEEEEPPVVDQRMPRRKSRPLRSTPAKAKGKRRAKN